MKIVVSQMVVVMVLFAALGCADEPAAVAPDGIAASWEGGSISDAELEELAAQALVSLRQQMYTAKNNALEQEIFDRLVEAAAGQQGITVDEYLKVNITDATSAPSEEEIAAVMAQYRSRLPQDDEEARKQVINYLNQQGAQKAHQALKERLFAANNVRVMLDPPRVEFTVNQFNPSRGPADAPVTIVEYTDFQCPYCGKAQETVDALRERYGDNLRHVFKNLPLPMHQQAHVAAQGALCAGDQGKFWEMHDWMFANRNTLALDHLIEQARELGLDETAFKACLDEKVHFENVNKDMSEARSFGITGTPGFVINGRIVTGAQPLPAFVTVIDDELRRNGIAVPEAKPAEETKVEDKIKKLPKGPSRHPVATD